MDGKRLGVILAVAGVVLALPLSGSDFEGQRFKLVDPFPGSEVEEFARDDRVTSRRIILGALKKINNVLVPEESEYVRGTRTSITYDIPDERRTRVVGQFFRDQVVSRGQILYECRGRDCGSSNYWADAVFDRPILYGPEEYQHYILAKMEGEAVYYVAIYIAQRGTREIYSHLDIIEAQDAEDLIDGPTIRSALESQGKFVLPWVVDDRTVAAIVSALDSRPGYRVAVVGHDRLKRGEAPRDAMERTRRQADALARRIIDAGMAESRVQSFGVGPLSPMDNEERGRLELVLLRR